MIDKLVFAIDSHAAGEPCRILLGPFVWKPFKTMFEKKEYFLRHYDDVRKALILEPHGHDNMFGSVLCEPCDSRADFGIFFIESAGILNMCGHGTIATTTALIYLGIINTDGKDEASVVYDTPAGLVFATAKLCNDKVKSVSFRNVPSFLYKRDCSVSLPQYGEIKFDISFGGSFFAAVPVEQFGLDIDVKNTHLLTEIGMKLKDEINHNYHVQHPTKQIDTVDLISLYSLSENNRAIHSCVVFGAGQIDRSPCGTSTCAMTAMMCAKGLIGVGDEIVSRSIIGTEFKTKAVENIQFENFDAIIPEITGSGYVMGIQQFIVAGDDPLKNGFSLSVHYNDTD